ncbi:MAG: hypothetical protein K0S81_2125 [Rhodospirillales bacterium]|nr:hypothetical protein [Rhodospirillales bacterium]
MTDLPSGASPLNPPRILSGAHRRIFAGLVVILVCLGGFGGWAALAPLNGAAIAPGVVGADSRNKTLQHLEGGIIREILVTEGASVEAGQTLLRLDGTRARASLNLIQGQLRSQLALEARLIAERDGSEQIDFADPLLGGEAGEVVALRQAQQALFVARREEIKGQRAILNQRIAELGEEISGLEAQRIAADAQIRLIAEEISSVRPLVEKGLEKKPRLLQLQRSAKALEAERAETIGMAARARQSIGEAQLQIAQLQVSHLSEVVEELGEVQDKIFDLRQKLTAAADNLDRLNIRAPQPGTLVKLHYNTIGGVIPPGQPILEFLPTGDRLVIEARLQPDDIDLVQVGMAAEVRLNAFNQRRTPLLLGRVTYVSADRLEGRTPGDQPFYQARVEVDPQSLALLPGAKLMAGMSAEVIIETGERTAFEYFATPILSSMRRAFRES